jgi:hypothetical protein
VKWYQQFSPSRRREAPCEGTNPPRLFTPGETKALTKSKVHQWARASLTVRGWSSSLISKIWLVARSGISKISIFKSIYLEHHVSHNELCSSYFCLKKWEELIYCGKSWNIGQVYIECLMFMNFMFMNCSNKFSWCFHKQNYYMFYRHANLQRTYLWIFLLKFIA